MALKIHAVPVGEINPAAYNPRTITDVALAGLKRSLERFGMVDPLVVNTRTGNLVGGHQRFRAACEMGWAEVPVVYVDVSDIEEKALNITLNNRHIAGTFNENELQLLLEEIRTEFDDDDFSGLHLDDLEIPPLEGEEADAPELSAGEKTSLAQMTFTVTEEQKEEIQAALSKAKGMGDFIDTGNENSNGNALARVCELFQGAH